MHDLITAAISEFTPKASVNKILSLDPTSTAVLPVRRRDDGAWIYVNVSPRSSMPSQFRRYAVPAAEATDATGLPHAFLAAALITYRSKPGPNERRYQAPLTLTPVQLNADESYAEIGAPMINAELREVLEPLGVAFDTAGILSDPNAVVLATEPDPRFVLTLNLAARQLRRLLEPAASGSASPALERLLQLSDGPSACAGFYGHETLVLSLDVDQRAAFQAAAEGLDLIVFGPPGCGKSALLCAIARAAVECDKRVLVCSTVASAIDVARRRLADAGFEPSQRLALKTLESFANSTNPDESFDLVLIDEATRMSVSEGLVVSSRGRQLILFGDPQQMQPSNDRQSIFNRAELVGLPIYRLNQHYRSRHPHLIEFSNYFSYGLALRTEQTPDLTGRDGVDLIVVRQPRIELLAGGTVNHTEANLVARRLLQHATANDPRSVGVVALTRAQAEAINRETAELLSANNLDISALNRQEDFFVRTTDAVQGEERDLILASLTIGPVAGRFNQKFGPLARGDALKRMNVMLTRARSRCELFTSILPSMIQRRGRDTEAGAALSLVLRTYNALLTADIALPGDPSAAALLQRYLRPGDDLDNLGIVTGWRPSGGASYILGIVGRSERLAPEAWDAAIAHLRAIGWTLIVYDEASFNPNDPELIRQVHEIRQQATKSAGRGEAGGSNGAR